METSSMKNMKPNLDEDDNPSLEINWLQHAVQVRQRGNHCKTSSSDWKELETSKQVTSVITTEISSMETNSKDSSSPQSDQVDQIKSAKAKMDEVKQENERLKKFIEKIMKDYQTLQTQFHDIVGKKVKPQWPNTPPSTFHMGEEEKLLSLSLGINSMDSSPNNEKRTSGLRRVGEEEGFDELGLKLRLDRLLERKQPCDEPCTNSSPKSSTEEAKQEDEAADAKWPPSKLMKTVRSGEDELLQQNQLKKARVSVRVRCSTSTINDGCQWRKYGQKIAKGNPCPRAYYRCTISPSCPVRKQVQRCLDDMTILTTTYEGIHDHPLPISATAMASTTSAAVSMLQSGSSSSTQFQNQAQTSMASLNGMNFTFQNSRTANQFYFTNSSISSYNSHPTITLDLTSSPSSHLNSFPLNFTNVQPSYSSTSTSSSFSFSSSPLASGSLGYVPTNIAENGYFPSRDHLFQPNFTEKAKYNVVNSIDEKSLMETRARSATQAKLESDPVIRSALAAAITLFASHDRRGEEKKV